MGAGVFRHPFPARAAATARLVLVLAGAVGSALIWRAAALQAAQEVGARDPAWSPDGSRIAASVLDQVRVMNPDGRGAKAVARWDDPSPAIERDPAWSPDGTRLALAVDRGAGFDLFVVSANGGLPQRVTTLAGDERWPSWTPDGRLVFAQRDGTQWDLYVVEPAARAADVPAAPRRLTDTPRDEMQPRVSPDGSAILYLASAGSDDGDVDIWLRPLERHVPGVTSPDAPSAARDEGSEDEPRERRPRRIVEGAGPEAHPAWSPAGDRVAYYAMREGVGSLWVSTVEPLVTGGSQASRPRPAAPPVLVSRRGGAPAWSPDGQSLLVADVPDADPVYNGNPERSRVEGPPLFATGGAYRLRRIPAPRAIDGGDLPVPTIDAKPAPRFRLAFDTVWSTLRDLYYGSGASATAWQLAGDEYRARAAQAIDERAFEHVVDEMIARQPLIKPVVTSTRAVVVSGHRRASEAGARILERGGNIVDAAIATAFALGVVEPEASGLGGDGTAVLYLSGMAEPTVIDYKDQTPIRATLDNPRIVRNGRLVADGPAAANIPGVVAGLDYLYTRYGSQRVGWEDLLQPAISLADDGFVLDEALPTSIAAGRAYLEKYAAARRIYLPDGRVPRPGERFVNRDYASTLRTLAREGGRAFYGGSIARRIADDMAAQGGIITLEDLAQYRAIERTPVSGRFRGHRVYAPPPPVSSGISLIETLQVLDGYRPSSSARFASDADYLHHVIEAWKVRDPLRRVADPERWAVDYARHLEPDHAAELFGRIDPRRAMSLPEDPPDEGPGAPRIGRGTTAFVVADAQGNMIAVTQTLSTWGGTFYVSEGLGFLYNNHLRSNRSTPGVYGQLLPLMRSSSTSNPTLVFREQSGGAAVPRLAVGCAGNAWITASVYEIIVNVLDGLPAQAAIEAPRLLIGRDPSDPAGRRARIQIEDRFPRAVLDDLAARGHVFQKIGRKGEVRYGYAALATVDGVGEQVSGGAEPRRSHAAVAVP